jgi:hypothetical protein
MGEVNKKEEKVTAKQEKLSYDELNQVSQQLFQENKMLRTKVQELSVEAFYKRIEYMFKVVELASVFSKEFVERTIQEIETVMKAEEEQKAEEEKK